LRSKLPLLIAFSFLYGFFFVNVIDLDIHPVGFMGYHLWLTSLYFIPFIPLLLTLGLDSLKLIFAMGLLVSLINDLLYYPAAIIIYGRKVDLWSFYMGQLGFKVWKAPPWNFDFLLFKIKPYSWLMGLTIYIRIAITTICFKHL